jgi:hypothetical protein
MNFRSSPQPMSNYEAISIGLTSVFCAAAMLLMYNYCKLIYKRLENGESMTEAVLIATVDSTPLFGTFVKWLSCVFDNEPLLPETTRDIKPAAISLKKIIVNEDDFYFADIPEYSTDR